MFLSLLIDRILYTYNLLKYPFSNGHPPWCALWVMNSVVKVQNPNSSGWDLFSFPLITKQLLTDSQHSQHNVFLAFQTGRQTDRVRKEKRWKLGSKPLNKLKRGRKRLCGSGRMPCYPEIQKLIQLEIKLLLLKTKISLKAKCSLSPVP